ILRPIVMAAGEAVHLPPLPPCVPQGLYTLRERLTCHSAPSCRSGQQSGRPGCLFWSLRRRPSTRSPVPRARFADPPKRRRAAFRPICGGVTPVFPRLRHQGGLTVSVLSHFERAMFHKHPPFVLPFPGCTTPPPDITHGLGRQLRSARAR